MLRVVVVHITRVRSITAVTITSEFIAATAGADICITATTLASGTIPGFMDGAGIPGGRRWSGVSERGVGVERRGGVSMRDGGTLIQFMPLRTIG